VFESRFADWQPERLPTLAAELVRQKMDVIVAIANETAFAAKAATATVPIVVWGAHGAVETGLVSSLAHPGANITGIETLAPELDAKRMALLKEIVPDLNEVAVLFNASDQASSLHLASTRGAPQTLKVSVSPMEVRRAEDLTAALPAIERKKTSGLLIFTDPLIRAQWSRVAEFAQQHGIPTVCEFKAFAEAGCLVAYGPIIGESYDRVAYQVDRILKGTKPADLPVEQSTKFELVINLKTAKALGLTIPPSVLARADDLIQ
jgi:putative ABC transport system substrate-binding protein